jgi:hypothetical protein
MRNPKIARSPRGESDRLKRTCLEAFTQTAPLAALLTSMVIYFLTFAVFVCAVRSVTDPAQKAALVDLFKATNGSTSWIRKWNLDSDPCDAKWFGVQCNGITCFNYLYLDIY